MPYWRYCIIQHSARRTQRYDGRTDLTERHCCGETIVWDNTRWRCKHTKPAHKDAAVTCYTYLRVSRYVSAAWFTCVRSIFDRIWEKWEIITGTFGQRPNESVAGRFICPVLFTELQFATLGPFHWGPCFQQDKEPLRKIHLYTKIACWSKWVFYNANIHCHTTMDTISMTHQWQCPTDTSCCWQI